MHIRLIRRPGLSNLDKYLSFLIDLRAQKKRRRHESLSDWAELEVKIACKKEDGYGAGCYKVYAQQFDSVNAEVGCFDTSHIIKIVDPDGNEIPCERFYAETVDDMVEIDKEEYLRRESSYREKLKKRGKK